MGTKMNLRTGKKIGKSLLCFVLLLAMVSTSLFAASGPAGQVTVTRPDGPVSKTVLFENWKIASSSVDVTATLPKIPEGISDADIANPNYATDGWAAAKAPESVLGSLIDGGYYDALLTLK